MLLSGRVKKGRRGDGELPITYRTGWLVVVQNSKEKSRMGGREGTTNTKLGKRFGGGGRGLRNFVFPKRRKRPRMSH